MHNHSTTEKIQHDDTPVVHTAWLWLRMKNQTNLYFLVVEYKKPYTKYFWILPFSILPANTDRSKQHERQAQHQFGKQF